MVFVDFRHPQPPDVIVLQFLQYTVGNMGVEQDKPHGQIRVFVDNIHIHIIHPDGYTQFLPAFPDQSLFPALAGFDFSSDKFPQQSPGFMRRTLTGQKPVIFPNQCRNHFGHGFTSFR